MRDKVIALAKEAGVPFNKWGMVGCDNCEQDIDEVLIRFYQLARADMKEQCAKVCDEVHKEYDGEEVSASWIATAIRALEDV